MERKLYTLKQVAEILQVSYETIRKWSASGKIKVKRINPRVVRVEKEEIDRLLENGGKEDVE